MELLEHYSRLGELVNGLILWLASVVTKTHVNFVHSDQAWTTRASDIVNLMDAMIVAVDRSFLVAYGLSETVIKSVQKSEDIYNDPLDTMNRFVLRARILNHPISNPQAHCCDMGLCPFGQDCPLADLLAELLTC